MHRLSENGTVRPYKENDKIKIIKNVNKYLFIRNPFF